MTIYAQILEVKNLEIKAPRKGEPAQTEDSLAIVSIVEKNNSGVVCLDTFELKFDSKSRFTTLKDAIKTKMEEVISLKNQTDEDMIEKDKLVDMKILL